MRSMCSPGPGISVWQRVGRSVLEYDQLRGTLCLSSEIIIIRCGGGGSVAEAGHLAYRMLRLLQWKLQDGNLCRLHICLGLWGHYAVIGKYVRGLPSGILERRSHLRKD